MKIRCNPQIPTNFERIATKILLFVAISLLFVAVRGLSASAASAATLYLSPASGTYGTGKNFTVSVRVSTAKSMNAAEGVLNFPSDKVQVVGVSKSGSIFNLWVQEPSYSNASPTGNLRFEGVVLNPGFTGDGKVLDITFAVKSEGSASVTFASGSVLANDGQGTNILSSMNGGTYNLQKSVSELPIIVAPGSLPPRPSLKHFVKEEDGELALFNTSENGTKWSNIPFANLVWIVPSGTTGVATYLSESPSSNPGTKSEGLFDSKIFKFLEEGKHYFHIRFINDRGAGPILHYPLFIDITPPKAFNVSFTNSVNKNGNSVYSTSNPKVSLTFSTSDDLSGVDHYETKLGSQDWIRIELPPEGGTYVTPKQRPGTYDFVIRAVDKAGNFADAKTQVTIEPTTLPVIESYTKHLTSPGENFVAQGTASPGANVELTAQRGGAEPIILSVKSDGMGKWRVIYEGPLASGRYKLTAKQILENGAESLETDQVYFSVNSWFWRAVGWLGNIVGFLVILTILLALLVVLIYYLWHRVGMFSRKLRKEAREAEEALRQGVSKIKKELERGDPREKIAKDLRSMQKRVEEEIKDIEKKSK